ncbi:MAG TPA: UrcA family protein [Steroidobacteraceae bacterium]|jgi:UrcA family protein|nr:UrcA family protein [Steroidobacteraceae bacterium]
MSRFTPNASFRPRAFTAALTLGVLAAGALLAAPAVASADANGFQLNVYYTANDLATEQGTRALYRRIVNAADEVCPGSDSLYSDVINKSKECKRAAIARAIGQIGSARLAAIGAQAVMRRG